jgi:hypothetical protein
MERTLKCILKKYVLKLRTGFECLRIGTSGGTCEHSNEPPGSIKGLNEGPSVKFTRRILHHGVN